LTQDDDRTERRRTGDARAGMAAQRIGMPVPGVAAREPLVAARVEPGPAPRRMFGVVVQRKQHPTLEQIQGEDQNPGQGPWAVHDGETPA
jgi:hypothetical protein